MTASFKPDKSPPIPYQGWAMATRQTSQPRYYPPIHSKAIEIRM
ncbi:MAG TPA: hypothetical protein V6D10_23085 [Trichocoleus sp.]